MNAVDISLYGILDPRRSLGRPLDVLAAQAAKGGVTLLQYRDKQASEAQMIATARAIVTALDGSGVPLLINDRVEVAKTVGAQGVHLGRDDMSPAEARRELGPEAIIGLTIKTPIDARNAPVDAIEYACIGGVYDTLSKDNPAAIGIDGWVARAAILRARAPGLPVGAIAGIDATNAGLLMAAGADGVAVISAIFVQPDVTQATRKLHEIVAMQRSRQ